MKMVKVLFGIVVFVALFVVEIVGYMALLDKKVADFETRRSEIVGLPVQAEYYSSISDSHESVILFTEGDDSTLKAAVGDDSPHRFDEKLGYKYAQVSYSTEGAKTINAIRSIGQIFIALAAFTFVGLVIFIAKV